MWFKGAFHVNSLAMIQALHCGTVNAGLLFVMRLLKVFCNLFCVFSASLHGPVGQLHFSVNVTLASTTASATVTDISFCLISPPAPNVLGSFAAFPGFTCPPHSCVSFDLSRSAAQLEEGSWIKHQRTREKSWPEVKCLYLFVFQRSFGQTISNWGTI